MTAPRAALFWPMAPLRWPWPRLRGHGARRGGLLYRDDRLRRSADRSVVRGADPDLHLSDDRQLRHLGDRRAISARLRRGRRDQADLGHPSHHLEATALGAWLDEQGIPALVGADTRAITIALREHGTIWAALAVGEEALARRRARLRRLRAQPRRPKNSCRSSPRKRARSSPAMPAARA